MFQKYRTAIKERKHRPVKLENNTSSVKSSLNYDSDPGIVSEQIRLKYGSNRSLNNKHLFQYYVKNSKEMKGNAVKKQNEEEIVTPRASCRALPRRHIDKRFSKSRNNVMDNISQPKQNKSNNNGFMESSLKLLKSRKEKPK